MIKRLPSVLRAAVMGTSLLIPVFSFGADAKFSDGIRRGEAQQTQIKTQVQHATEDLTSIINELNRNGIAGEDVQILTKIRDILGDLTSKDMATVIVLLQEARNVVDPGKFRGDATEAVVQQQSIVLKMRQLLLDYKRQQELYELALRFTELAQRQNGNIKEAKALVRAMKNRTQLDELLKSSKALQASEEESIRDETHSLLVKLASLAAAETETGDRLSKSLEQAEKKMLEVSLRDAVTHLKDDKPFLAANTEVNARDRLYELASLIAPVEDAAAKLRKAAEKIDKGIAEEKIVIAKTAALAKARGNADEEPYIRVEDRQADNVDLTNRIRKEIETLAPVVTDLLKIGQGQMQAARGSINEFKRDAAIDSETQALAKLEEARKLLEAQIAKADAEKRAGDTLALAKLEEARDKVAKAIQDEQRVALNTANQAGKEEAKKDTPKEEVDKQIGKQQEAVAKNTEEVKQSLPEEGKEAVPPLDQANQNQREAKKSLDDQNAKSAQPLEQQALNHLNKAKSALDQKIAELQNELGRPPDNGGKPDQIAKSLEKSQDDQPGKEPGKKPGKGSGQGDGPPSPNGQPTPGNPDENQATKGHGDRKGTDANANGGGPRGNVGGASNFVHLPPRERQAVKQAQKDKYPEEYGPAIEQYLKNLSDQENK